jgi:trimeric autotransporter adhesin
MIMKNKFYVTKTKTRAAFFALSLLFCGLFASGLQAQGFSHIWKAGTVGDWNDSANWDTFSLIQWNPGAGFAATTTTISSTTAATGVLVGDVIWGGVLTGNVTVTAVDNVSATKVVTFSPAVAVAPTNTVYQFTRPTTASVPGSAIQHNVLINSGTCTLSANPANPIRVFAVANTSTTNQGKLVINSGVTLSVSNTGTGNNLNAVILRGGLIENNGTLAATATGPNGSPIRFQNAAFEPSSDWGITGTGAVNVIGTAAAPTSFAGFTFEQSTVTRAPRLVLSGSSSCNIGATSASPAVIFSALANSKASIEGTGIAPGGAGIPAVFGTAATSTVDVASTVTLTNSWTGIRASGNDIAGVVNNYGTITYIVGSQLKIAGTGGAVLNNYGKLNIFGTLANAGNIVNKSTPTANGSIISAVSVTNCTQERYLTSNQRGWRLLSNPMGGVTYGTVATLSTTPIALGANTAKTYGSALNEWTIANTDDLQTWTKSAISLFIRGTAAEVTTTTYTNPSNPANVTLSIKGTATNTAPAQIVTVAGRYYLLANPYTAPISVAGIIGASTGLSNTVSYYDPTIGSTSLITKAGGYSNPIVSGAAGSATDVIIPAMGAIFVQASVDGTIDIPASTIFTGTPTAPSGNYNLRVKQVAAANSLKLEVLSGTTYHDAVTLRFKAVTDASNNIDFGKLPNEIFNAYTIAGNKNMAVSELELTAQAIPLGITTALNQGYSFKVAENTIPAGFEAVLFDSYLNKNTALTAGTDYAFAIDSNPASQGDNRFVINLKALGTLGLVANELDSQIKLWPNPAHAELNITNAQNDNDGASKIEISSLNGQLIHSQKSNPGTTTTIQTKGWSTGVYILKASNNGTETTKKLIIQ